MIPLNNNILLKTAKAGTQETEKGLKLSTDIKMRNIYTESTGVIMALGKGVREEYLDLEVGDEVRFQEHSGYKVNEDEDSLYRIVQDIDIYVITTKGK